MGTVVSLPGGAGSPPSFGRWGVAGPVGALLAVAAPAVLLRLLGVQPGAGIAIIAFGGAVVAAAFLLAWAAEAAETEISGGLAIAVLAVIAVLPEYAVDLYFAYSAGSNPHHVAYAAANMTGSNRLLLGVGWSVVVLVGLAVASRRTGRVITELVLESRYRLELGFLAVASVLSVIIPVTGQIHLVLGVLLLGLFVFYLIRTARGEHSHQLELVGPPARIAYLSVRLRRGVLLVLFVLAAAILLLCAQPFADALVAGGATLGIDRFLLVQWLAPLASESPELIVAVVFAVRGKSVAALGMLISAKVNQWTLLVGSLPIAYVLGGGSTAVQLDGRQVEEFLLTAAQTVLGVTALLMLRFPRWLAPVLLGLFAVQFLLPGTSGRLVLAAVYAVIAVVALIINRGQIVPTITAPFRRRGQNTTPPQQTSDAWPGRERGMAQADR